MLTTEDFDFDLPEELIAQTPLTDRASSRLLVLDRETKEMADKHFYEIIDELNAGDALVMNNTRVRGRHSSNQPNVPKSAQKLHLVMVA